MAVGSIRNAVRALASDRASRLIAGGGLILVTCLVVLGAYLCLDLRDTAWRNAERTAANMLALIEESVGSNIRTFDQSLREAARLAARPELAAADPEIGRLALFDTATRGTGLGTLAVTDATGRVRRVSDPDQPPPPDLGDLPEFQRHRSDPAAGLIIAGPTRSPVSGRMAVRLTRRIDTPDGSFAGLVSGTVYLDYFQALFARLRVERGSNVSIVHRDGTLLVRAPSDAGKVGRSIATAKTFRSFVAHGGRDLRVGPAGIDGRLRLYGFSNIPDLPLIVTVGIEVGSIRDGWIYKAGIVAALLLCLSVLTGCLTVLLQREVARRAAREATSRADNAALALLARTDGLTGLPNRRGYDEALASAWDRAVRTATPLALLVVDADHFKQFNDTFGHHRGDAVLRAVADCLRRTLDPGSFGGRIGGEEFAVILPGADAAAAHAAADRIRRSVAALRIAHAPEVGAVVTVSVGLASVRPRSGDMPEALFSAADKALYAAKGAGRNRVRAAPASAPPSLALSA